MTIHKASPALPPGVFQDLNELRPRRGLHQATEGSLLPRVAACLMPDLFRKGGAAQRQAVHHPIPWRLRPALLHRTFRVGP